jgi:predicted RNA-binding protein associated with RNAse of E/G family
MAERDYSGYFLPIFDIIPLYSKNHNFARLYIDVGE